MRLRIVTPIAAALLAVGALVGCAGGAPTAPARATPTAPTTAPPTIAPGVEVLPTAAPELHPGGTAEQNKLFWDATIDSYWQRFGLGSTQTMIDLLLSNGFDPAILEITYDYTAIGLGVDSIEVSARFSDACLLAVVRNERYATAVMPILGTGLCLVGDQYPIG
ncbi:MAG TPA: hypothetical protein VNQ52_03525 [Microbacteriaceae bacterium]|nr:hypothetical protein [Microbacteriaceae bacterium]